MPVQTETVVRELKKWGMSVPSLGKLVVALMADSRVPRTNKLVVGAITAYLVTPVGIVRIAGGGPTAGYDRHVYRVWPTDPSTCPG